MCCDYYVIKRLIINYIDDDDNVATEHVEIEREKGYFFNITDSSYESSDDESYSEVFVKSETYLERYNRKYKHYLDVKYKPKVLFLKGKWKDDKIKKMYSKYLMNINVVENELISVIKDEVRIFSGI